MNLNVNNNYLSLLISQFKSATGTRYIDEKSEKFIKEFSNWIKISQRVGFGYTDLLWDMDLRFNDESCAEVGKGVYDSVVAKNFLTQIITPYPELLDRNVSKITSSKFKVQDGIPTLSNFKSENKNSQNPLEQIKTYMTQNPYDISCIHNWHQLHNNGNYNIIVGIYGKTYDEDINKKRNILKTIKSKMDGNIIEELSYLGDSYFHVVATENKIKKKVRIR